MFWWHPLKLGSDVTVAGGSVVTEDVPDDCLVIARARQVIKPGWRLKKGKAGEGGEGVSG